MWEENFAYLLEGNSCPVSYSVFKFTVSLIQNTAMSMGFFVWALLMSHITIAKPALFIILNIHAINGPSIDTVCDQTSNWFIKGFGKQVYEWIGKEELFLQRLNIRGRKTIKKKWLTLWHINRIVSNCFFLKKPPNPWEKSKSFYIMLSWRQTLVV